MALPAGTGGTSQAWSRLVAVTVDGQTSLIAWLPPRGVVRIAPGDDITWHAVEEFDSSLATDWPATASIVIMLLGPLAMLASASAARRTAVRRRMQPRRVMGLLVVTAVGLLGLAMVVAFVVAPVVGNRVLPLFAAPIGLAAFVSVAWSWSAAGRRPPALSPPTQPGPFSRSDAGSELSPPDPNGRVG